MKNIIKIFKISKPQHKWILVACVLITIQAVLQQATPVTLKFVVDELSAQIANQNGDYEKLTWLFILILVINLSVVILNTGNQRLGDYIASRLGRFLTEVFYKKIFTLPQSFFDGEISGKIVNQLNRGIASIRDFVNGATNFIVPALLQAIFGIAVLSYFDLTIGLLALSVFPVYILITSYSTKRWGKVQEEKNVYEDSVRGRIAEVINNIRLVKTYSTQPKEWKFVSNNYQTINKLYDKQSTEYHILNFIREFGLEVVLVVILYLIFQKTFFGSLTLGEMVLIIQLLNQLRWPLFAMSYILENVQRAEADSKTYFEILDLKSKEKFIEKSTGALVKKPEIIFENVSFAYQKDDEVLKNINLTIKSNQTVALVGHSGAGKTTLINLILKLYEPTKGNLFMSKKNYSRSDHSWVRSHMALVFQDTELFSTTIKENVAYGKENTTDREVIDALKKANAWDFVEKFKDGLDEKIGERGVRLSGGQKQRIQVARAILQNKPILILDEATSSLDSRSESLVQEALEELFKNRLVIIIAHRFSTIQNADRVIVLDQGGIVDDDTPQKLAKKKGLYQELLQYQIAGNKKLLSKYELR
ncbi:MAG: ABC transporter ATP-binding protein [bacterium]|nr:MAG: ABC transporter ATP-binding protein [bacterium]